MKSQRSFLHRCRSRLALHRFLIFSLVASMFGTSALADLSLGSYSLSKSAAPTIKTHGSLRSVLGRGGPRLGFVRKIGGVAFDAVAEPGEGITVESLELSYVPENADGTRLVVTINGEPLATSIHDWQLLPIARFANGEETSCFTLFGELEDEAEAERLRQSGSRILNYAASFEDTLLGLRLFQLDILILAEDFSVGVPYDENGEFVLGRGEQVPARSNALKMEGAYRQRRNDLEREAELDGHDIDYDSWVICDIDDSPSFSVDNGQLTISGEPYYYFWRNDLEDLTAVEDRLFLESLQQEGLIDANADLATIDQDEAFSRISAELDSLRPDLLPVQLRLAREAGFIETDGDYELILEDYQTAMMDPLFEVGTEQNLVFDGESAIRFLFRMETAKRDAANLGDEERDETLEQIRSLYEEAEKRSAELSPEAVAAYRQIADLEAEARAELAPQQEAYDELRDKVARANSTTEEKLEAYQDSDEARGIHLEWLSREHEKATPLLAEMNPPVWNAGRTTMRFGAFFRYCKTHFADEWQRFVAELEAEADLASSQPAVETPTVMTLALPSD